MGLRASKTLSLSPPFVNPFSPLISAMATATFSGVAVARPVAKRAAVARRSVVVSASAERRSAPASIALAAALALTGVSPVFAADLALGKTVFNGNCGAQDPPGDSRRRGHIVLSQRKTTRSLFR